MAQDNGTQQEMTDRQMHTSEFSQMTFVVGGKVMSKAELAEHAAQKAAADAAQREDNTTPRQANANNVQPDDEL
jgi:glycerol-3-phosphate dehydrogenase